ncbi:MULTISPECIES: hypothetical protein [Clostridium]|uniref:Uncharacterized protein n=1 Tax=Clostridium botulinum B str. Osaka05 TaxID=1407017 RepID=A0A060N958_CLOBO|nr:MULTISPECIES: hypothetical protein [Clostridium]EKS4345145.1 hypothetical protein [Clostridium botulinum]EKS4395822.1 hypothetical protein [Clostridium botulinum]MCW6110201.1 hypothetical protein [Clostridium sporogenes]BAO05015.1 uncharacterized protein CBO05P1_296 [Clostridium botulinum B str. Osaka05]BAO05163.1 uncharacterized protein CBO05P2_138 [Clostridium botulinum B str. Osaka05]
MTKQITIAVHFCEECPRFDDCTDKCTDEDKIIENRYTIPEWCPLEELI